MGATKLELVDEIARGNKAVQKCLRNLDELEDDKLLVLQELLEWLKLQEKELDRLMPISFRNLKH